jgi:hypothetical protein
MCLDISIREKAQTLTCKPFLKEVDLVEGKRSENLLKDVGPKNVYSVHGIHRYWQPASATLLQVLLSRKLNRTHVIQGM